MTAESTGTMRSAATVNGLPEKQQKKNKENKASAANKKPKKDAPIPAVGQAGPPEVDKPLPLAERLALRRLQGPQEVGANAG